MTLPIQSKRIHIPVLLLLAAAGVLFVCLRGSGTDPSPLKHGPEAPAEYGAVPAPAFDHPSGFYDGPFDLAIAVPDGTRVYYTLDCSDPGESGIPYGGPVRVEDATPRENVYSIMPDTRPFFLHESPEIRQYVLPEAPVDKCTVLRALAVSESGVHSPVAEAVYFVGPCAAKYREGTVVSVIVDPEELFDEETGIYVAGSVKKAAEDDPAVPANYFRTGAFSRRRASALFFRDGACGHGAIPVTLRLKGHSSRAYLPKSMDLTALDAWGNAAFFPDGLAPGEIPAQTLTLSMAGQDQIARFNDHMVGDRCRGLACGVMQSAPCVVFLDGEYWGFSWLTEEYDESFFTQKYGIAEGNLLMLKEDTVQIGKAKNLELYRNFAGYVSGLDLADPERYAEACGLIDLESLLDYYSVECYLARNGDWPTWNYALYRSLLPGDGAQEDTKWRYLLFDLNNDAMTADLAGHLTLSAILHEEEMYDPVFASLWRNEQFRRAFRDRILSLAGTRFEANAMSEYIDAYIEETLPILQPTWERFYGPDNGCEEEFLAIMESHRAFFAHRREAVEAWEFGV